MRILAAILGVILLFPGACVVLASMSNGTLSRSAIIGILILIGAGLLIALAFLPVDREGDPPPED